MKYFLCLLLLFVCICSRTVQAETLQWKQWNETEGMSYHQVQDTILQGEWRYATYEEFEEFLHRYGYRVGTYHISETEYGKASKLFDSMYGKPCGEILLLSEVVENSLTVSAILLSPYEVRTATGTYWSEMVWKNFSLPDTENIEFDGHVLVCTVPEPSTHATVLLGVLYGVVWLVMFWRLQDEKS